MTSPSLYDLGVTNRDGSTGRFHLDAGWHDRIRDAVVLSLVPRDSTLPAVVVRIPPDAVPVAFSRVKTSFVNETELAAIRVDAVGYDHDDHSIRAWVLPDGVVEIGPDSFIADARLNAAAGMRDVEPSALRVRSLPEAEIHVVSLTARISAIEDVVRDHAQRFDTLQTPFWKRCAYWVDGWPWRDLNGERHDRPWHRLRSRRR